MRRHMLVVGIVALAGMVISAAAYALPTGASDAAAAMVGPYEPQSRRGNAARRGEMGPQPKQGRSAREGNEGGQRRRDQRPDAHAEGRGGRLPRMVLRILRQTKDAELLRLINASIADRGEMIKAQRDNLAAFDRLVQAVHSGDEEAIKAARAAQEEARKALRACGKKLHEDLRAIAQRVKELRPQMQEERRKNRPEAGTAEGEKRREEWRGRREERTRDNRRAPRDGPPEID